MKNRLALPIVFLFFISSLCLSFVALGQTQTWTQISNGLYGGPARSMAAVGETIFAGTEGGVFKSTDNAATWTPVNEGLKGSNVNSLVATGNTLVVAFNGGGSYWTSNNGASWTAVNFPDTHAIIDLAVIGENVYGFMNNGEIHAFNRNTHNVTAIPTGLSHASGLVGTDSRLFVGTYGSGLFSSDNGGATWEKIEFDITVVDVYSISANRNSVLIWTNFAVLLSTDNGETWSSTSLPPGYSNLTVIGSKMIVGDGPSAYVSTNSGSTWNSIDELPGSYGLIANAHGYYSAAQTGVFKSTDEGSTWVFSSTGITSGSINAVTSKNDALYATLENSIYKSTDQGGSWTKLNTNVPIGNPIFSLTTVGNNILAGTFVSGVYVSTDNGASWAKASGVNGAKCFAKRGSDVYAGCSSGLFASSNNGISWSLISSKSVEALEVKGTDLFVSYYDGVVKIPQSGQAIPAQGGLELSNNWVTSFATIDNKLFCATANGGMYTSGDNGATWTVLSGIYGSGYAGDVIFADGKYLYATVQDQGIFYSGNYGATWTSFNNGILEEATTTGWEVASFYAMAGKIYAGTATTSLWSVCAVQTGPVITVTNSNSAEPVLTSNIAEGNRWYLNGSLISGANGPTITATESGSYSVEVEASSGCTSPRSEDEVIVITGDLTHDSRIEVTIFPNPVSKNLFVNLSPFAEGEKVAIEVFDAMGKPQMSLEGNGMEQLTINVAELSQGLYVIRARGTNVHQVKFVKD